MHGSVPEWLNGAVSKTAIPQNGIGGSNPPASAKYIFYRGTAFYEASQRPSCLVSFKNSSDHAAVFVIKLIDEF